MKKIASFCVDHTTLVEGMYISRIDGDITTYDIRMVKPNDGIYLENAAMHTLEHLFATYARNTRFEESVIYVGPMGCRTGFYMLLRDVEYKDAINIVVDAMDYIKDYEDDIPGVSARECGNYQEHNLEGAKSIAHNFHSIIKNWSVEKLNY